MKESDYLKLKKGDKVLIEVEVVETSKKGTLGFSNAFVSVAAGSENDIFGGIKGVVSAHKLIPREIVLTAQELAKQDGFCGEKKRQGLINAIKKATQKWLQI